METFSFNEDHGNLEEYLDLKPVIADGKTNRGYWVINMCPRYFFIVCISFSSYEQPIRIPNFYNEFFVSLFFKYEVNEIFKVNFYHFDFLSK